jgi:hypothetical protein
MKLIFVVLIVIVFMLPVYAEKPTTKQEEAAKFLIRENGYVCDNINYIVAQYTAIGIKYIVVCNDLQFRYEITEFNNKVRVRLN